MIPAIDSEALSAMSVGDLVSRMDQILRQSLIEKYGTIPLAYRLPIVRDILMTKKVSSFSEVDQRHLAHIAFSYVVQMELGMVSCGISNRLLFNESYNENTSWQSPAFRLRDGALRQYEIVSSRIAMEVFMDLLFFLETRERMRRRKKGSKLRAFAKWITDPQNQFHYFALVLLTAYSFDRRFRSPEVHGGSKFPRRLLMLQRPTFEELNEPNVLTNALISCWEPLLEILNGKKPAHMHVGEAGGEWFSTYTRGTEKEVLSKLTEMFATWDEESESAPRQGGLC